MHKRKRLRTLTVLMGLSFIMLAGFTLRWLYRQYGEEQVLLKNKLKTVFDEKIGSYFDQAFKSKYLTARKPNEEAILAGDSFLILRDSVDLSAKIASEVPALLKDSMHRSMGVSMGRMTMHHEVSISADSSFTKKIQPGKLKCISICRQMVR